MIDKNSKIKKKSLSEKPSEVLKNKSQMPDLAPAMRTVALEADANPTGDIFGGWLLGQMDLAGAMHAYRATGNRIVTAGVNEMSFYKPIFIGDEVFFFTKTQRTGTTSITVLIECWVERDQGREVEKAAEGLYTFVAIDDARRPVPIKKSKQ